MKHINSQDIEKMHRFYRGNLINSITGYKSASLLGTTSTDGIDNVAVFSSVTHLGSNPAMFSFIQRPLGYGAGNTYENLKSTGVITLNHISESLIKQAHLSSQKFPEDISEFEALHIEKVNREGIIAPFVKDSPIQIAASYVNDYYLEENRCRLVICKITDIFLKDGIQLEDGWVSLEKAGSVTINGLDAYGTAQIKERWSYAESGEEITQLPTE